MVGLVGYESVGAGMKLLPRSVHAAEPQTLLTTLKLQIHGDILLCAKCRAPSVNEKSLGVFLLKPSYRHADSCKLEGIQSSH